MLETIGAMSQAVLVQTWLLVGEMAPYLLFGFLMAGILHAFIRPSFIERHLGGKGFWQVLKATLIGVPMPLCSCSVIPVTASLRRSGAHKGATSAFISATPETGVDSIAATWGLLGPIFALTRVVVAFFTGIVTGVTVDALDPDPPGPLDAEARNGRNGNGEEADRSLGGILRYGFLVLPRDIGKALLGGLLVAGLVGALVPPGYFAGHLTYRPLLYAAVTLVAVPMYVCSTGSIPVALALVRSGLPPGVALAFLIVGPATNAATIAALWKMLGRRTVMIYLVSIIACAWAAGAVFDHLSISMDVADAAHHAARGAGPLQHVAGAVLLALLVYGFLPERWREWRLHGGAKGETFTVHGMHCQECAAKIRRRVRALEGVEDAAVSLADGTLTVSGPAVDRLAVARAVRELGYDMPGEA